MPSEPSSTTNSRNGFCLLAQILVWNFVSPMLLAFLAYVAVRPEIEEHDVFLSFRGEDTGNNFVSHLRSALLQNSIKPFVDDEFRRGEMTAPALLKAIDDSKIAVIIFSKNYASSPWCLDELVKIVECHAHRNTAIPIFYNIRPSDVMDQSGVFAQAFETHDESLKQPDKVERWRKAINQSANLAGWDSQNTKPEARLIEEVVKEISTQLKRISAKYQTRRRWLPYFLLPLLILVSIAATYHFSQQQEAEAHKHAVFVNCYGEITLFRKLVDALDKAGIKSFNDYEQAGGEHMTKTIEKAIEGSKVAVIIFSAGYAYSARCLDELVQIVDRHKSQGLELVPVCYQINEHDVKQPEWFFREAFVIHRERRRGRNLQRWRKAMKEAASDAILVPQPRQEKNTEAKNTEARSPSRSRELYHKKGENDLSIIPAIVEAVKEKMKKQSWAGVQKDPKRSWAGVQKDPVRYTYRLCLTVSLFLVSFLVLILSNEMLIQSLVGGEIIRETQCMPL